MKMNLGGIRPVVASLTMLYIFGSNQDNPHDSLSRRKHNFSFSSSNPMIGIQGQEPKTLQTCELVSNWKERRGMVLGGRASEAFESLALNPSPRKSVRPDSADIPPVFPPVGLTWSGTPPVFESRWRKYSKIILPHVGLVLLCIIYTVGGATVFYFLERTNEDKIRKEGVERISATKERMLESLWELGSEDRMEITKSAWEETANRQIDNLTRILFKAFEDRYISLDNIQNNQTNGSTIWTFPAAVFFAASTVTTIGYGRPVPVTETGRIICVVFGLLGIPLMLVTIADIGKFVGGGMVIVFRRYDALRRHIRRKLKRGGESREPRDFVEEDEEPKVPVSWVLLIIVGYTALGGLLFGFWEDWTFFECFYFSFITMSTIGFGDYVPTEESYFLIILLYIWFGLALTTMAIDLVGSHYIRQVHYFGRKIRSAKEALRTVGDMVRYTAFLRRKYGLSDAELREVPFGKDLQEFMQTPCAYTPADINFIRYIDQRTSRMDSGCHLGDRIRYIDEANNTVYFSPTETEHSRESDPNKASTHPH